MKNKIASPAKLALQTIVMGILFFYGSSAAAGRGFPEVRYGIEQPSYWDSHEIVLGEVESISSADEKWVLDVVGRYSDGPPGEKTIVFEKKGANIEPHAMEFEPETKLDSGNYVLISFEKEKDGIGTVLWKVPNDAGDLNESCGLIQTIRKTGDLPAGLQRSMKAANAVAERYAINAMMATDLKHVDKKTCATVSALRADKAQQMDTRELASDFLQQVAVANGEKTDDWEWIASVLRNESQLSSETLNDLTERMLVKDGEDRMRTINLICELATDLQGPSRRRAAALNAGDFRRLGDGNNPQDLGNLKLMDLCIGRMNDPSSSVRTSAAWAMGQVLYQMKNYQGSRIWWMPLTVRAAAAIRVAEAKENGMERGYLQTMREEIEELMRNPDK